MDQRGIDRLVRAGEGVVRRADLLALGMGEDTIWRQTRAGIWDVRGPGILVHHTATPGLRTDTRVTALWRPDAMLTGWSAAVLWPQEAWRDQEMPSPPMLIDRRAGRGPWRTVRNPIATPVLVAGCRVADRLAILTDLIRFLPERQALAIASAAVRTGLVTGAALRAATPAFASLDRVRQLRRVVSRLASGAHSIGESDLHDALRAGGITGWQANVTVAASGRRFVLDVAFPAERVYLEFDGRAAHGAAAFDTDRDRQNALAAAGWLVIRVTWEMLASPERRAALLHQIRAVLHQRRTTPAASVPPTQ